MKREYKKTPEGAMRIDIRERSRGVILTELFARLIRQMAFGEILILSPARVDEFLLFRIQQRRPFRIKRLQHLKPVFDLHIFRNRNLRVARIQFERIFTQRYLTRIVAVQRPVSRVNRRLLLRRPKCEVVPVRYAVAVRYDYRRFLIAVCFGHRLNRLHFVCAERNLATYTLP